MPPTSIGGDIDFQKYKVASLKFKVANVPNYLVARMDSFVIAKTGKIIFEKYFVFDTIYSGYYLSKESNPKYGDSIYYSWDYSHYYFVYNLRIPEKPWHSLSLGWPTDTLGCFNKNHLPYGIPICTSDSSSFFLIDSAQAISIAQSDGLKDCFGSPTAEFKLGIDTHNSNKECFAWVVHCQHDKKGDEQVNFLIDVNNGKVVIKDTIRIIYMTL